MHTYGAGHVIVNLGSGPRRFRSRRDIINVDYFAFDEVDICADAGNLPIGTGRVDLVLSIAMLEHVLDPLQVISEIRRILKSGGLAFCYVPFMQPFHAAPGDFQRWSEAGLRQAFKDMEVVECGVGAGPVSSWLWITIEALAVILSFGINTLYDFWRLLLMVALFPIKYLDEFFARLPHAKFLASGFYIIARKEKN
jgi:SAM-dependent methyltransferase